MFKRSKIKIVAAVMSVLIVLFAGTLILIYFSSYQESYQRNRNMLEKYADSYFLGGEAGRGPLGEGHEGLDRKNGPEKFMSSMQFYAVAFDGTGKATEVRNPENSAYSSEELTETAQTLIKGSETYGSFGSMTYLIRTEGNRTLVVLTDSSIMSDDLTALLRYMLIFGGLSTVILLAFSVCLAKRIINPLEANYQRQKQFISDASHELKTPISVISANSEMLSHEIGENHWLTNIQFESDRMAVLVRQLLELAKAENVSFKSEKVDLSHVVTGCTLPFEGVAFDNGRQLDYDISQQLFVNGDSDQLGHLVTILLDNAVAHSLPGSTIRIRLQAEKRSARLTVSNEGEAIPEEARSAIFERFYRVDESRSGESNRYGLGLAIAKAITLRHSGKIGVDCRDGRTEFYVLLPLWTAWKEK